MTPRIPALVKIDAAYTHEKILRALQQFSDILDVQSVDSDEVPAEWRRIQHAPRKLLWMEYEDLPWESLIARGDPNDSNRTVFNSYCIRKGLIRKAEFAYIVQKYLAKRPQSILHRAIPGTYLLEVDHPDYLDESLMDCFEVDEILTQNEQVEDDAHRTKLTASPEVVASSSHVMCLKGLLVD